MTTSYLKKLSENDSQHLACVDTLLCETEVSGSYHPLHVFSFTLDMVQGYQQLSWCDWSCT